MTLCWQISVNSHALQGAPVPAKGAPQFCGPQRACDSAGWACSRPHAPCPGTRGYWCPDSCMLARIAIDFGTTRPRARPHRPTPFASHVHLNSAPVTSSSRPTTSSRCVRATVPDAQGSAPCPPAARVRAAPCCVCLIRGDCPLPAAAGLAKLPHARRSDPWPPTHVVFGRTSRTSSPARRRCRCSK